MSAVLWCCAEVFCFFWVGFFILADGVAGAVVDDVADGEGLTVGESVLFQRRYGLI